MRARCPRSIFHCGDEARASFFIAGKMPALHFFHCGQDARAPFFSMRARCPRFFFSMWDDVRASLASLFVSLH
jgi:hypothetical protein